MIDDRIKAFYASIIDLVVSHTDGNPTPESLAENITGLAIVMGGLVGALHRRSDQRVRMVGFLSQTILETALSTPHEDIRKGDPPCPIQ